MRVSVRLVVLPGTALCGVVCLRQCCPRWHGVLLVAAATAALRWWKWELQCLARCLGDDAAMQAFLCVWELEASQA